MKCLKFSYAQREMKVTHAVPSIDDPSATFYTCPIMTTVSWLKALVGHGFVFNSVDYLTRLTWEQKKINWTRIHLVGSSGVFKQVLQAAVFKQ
jgi:hypothetical protein